MFKRFIICLVAVSIFGHVVGHGYEHLRTNFSSNDFHDERFVHYAHDSLALHHHEHPTETEHFHIEEFIKRSSLQKSLKNKLATLWNLDSYLKLVKFKQFTQLHYFKPRNISSNTLDRVNLPLRI